MERENQSTHINIEGKITNIMESDPPELVVKTSDNTYYVVLSQNTRIIRGTEEVDLSNLSIDSSIKISGIKRTHTSMIAELIYIK